ncbi:hypothetical protein LARV_00132 [Longilinea arvoryzae]|uniref:Lipoprotein n=1 Tax=Longilinea arvoryzae TaxID=360412 RepID=A0A0S7BB31_9CHLR|nr:hypothetical protein [Longilinea arvoryzae]GAP12397.1 hypothetical protein LARV_00132 [Longilinea arvoryzae]
MKLRHRLFILVACGLLLSACGNALATPIDRKTPLALQPSPTLPAATLTPQATDELAPFPPAVTAARQALADRLGTQPDAVAVAGYVAANWSDACLELGSASESCALAVTPGYRVFLKVGENFYIFHTNQTGDLVRQELTPADIPQAAVNARQALAARLGLDLDLLITVVSVEEVEWPDSCLGVSSPDVMCAQMVTPGYRVALEYAGLKYEYHTDLSGERVVAATIAP